MSDYKLCFSALDITFSELTYLEGTLMQPQDTRLRLAFQLRFFTAKTNQLLTGQNLPALFISPERLLYQLMLGHGSLFKPFSSRRSAGLSAHGTPHGLMIHLLQLFQ